MEYNEFITNIMQHIQLKKRVAVGFDVDGTLIQCDFSIDKPLLYKFITVKQYNTIMMCLLKDVRSLLHGSVFILTSRPPATREQIKHLFGVENVITNIVTFKNMTEVDNALSDMNKLRCEGIQRKIEIMQQIGKDADIVYYFDDEYQYYTDVPSKIVVLAPLLTK